MSTVVIESRVTGNADAEDRLAMDLAVAQANVRRAALGRPLLSVLPADRRASYEATLTPLLVRKHKVAIETAVANEAASMSFQQLKIAWSQATPAQRAAARAELP